MAKNVYPVVDGVTRKQKKAYVVIDNVTRNIKKMYAVVNGVTRLIWESVFKISGQIESIAWTGVIADLFIYGTDPETGMTSNGGNCSTAIKKDSDWKNTKMNSVRNYPSHISLNGKTGVSDATCYVWNSTKNNYVQIGTFPYSSLSITGDMTGKCKSVISANGDYVLVCVVGKSDKTYCSLGLYRIENNTISLVTEYPDILTCSSSETISIFGASPDLSKVWISPRYGESILFSIKTDGTYSQLIISNGYSYSGFFSDDGLYFIKEGNKVYYIGDGNCTSIGSMFYTGYGNYVISYNPYTQKIVQGIRSGGDDEYYRVYQLSPTRVTELGTSTTISLNEGYITYLYDIANIHDYGLIMQYDETSASVYEVEISWDSAGAIAAVDYNCGITYGSVPGDCDPSVDYISYVGDYNIS